MIGFTVKGRNAAGEAERYPAPDDVLRNTGEPGWPVVTDPAEALTEARCALVESEGWRQAHVYRIDDDGTHAWVGSVTPQGVKVPRESAR